MGGQGLRPLKSATFPPTTARPTEARTEGASQLSKAKLQTDPSAVIFYWSKLVKRTFQFFASRNGNENKTARTALLHAPPNLRITELSGIYTHACQNT